MITNIRVKVPAAGLCPVVDKVLQADVPERFTGVKDLPHAMESLE